MPANYVLLETIELSQDTNSVTFDNIPQTGYTDLKVIFSVRDTSSGLSNNIIIRLNSVTTSQSVRSVQGTGTAVSSYSDAPIYTAGVVGNTATSNTFSNCEMYITNYALTTQHKSVAIESVTENNGTAAQTSLNAGLFASNSAITTIQFAPNGAVNFMAGSTFSIYGIAALGTIPMVAPLATGGNIVAQDGTYWYHAFLSSGTFTPAKALSCDVLQIAGGGGGGHQQAGGGGAGGLLGFASESLTSANYTVTVGAGGAGATSAIRGSNGVNSQFGSLTSVVGGGGGGALAAGGGGQQNAASGGSGGGGGTVTSSGGTGGAATSGQGSAGGAGNSDGTTFRNGGGGGGAGGAGVNSGASQAGTGGAGSSAYSSYASATSTGVSGNYAGGGGGGGNLAGTATAGGGAGGAGVTGANGTANTGGGGGGGGSSSFINGFAGGSGIVIIRYPISS